MYLTCKMERRKIRKWVTSEKKYDAALKAKIALEAPNEIRL